MKALQVDKKVGRIGAARLLAALAPTAAAKLGPLELVTIDPPALPGDGWHRVHTNLAGICGSDLATVEGHASPYFDDWVSFPFVPGHEVVGHLESGQRVVIEPVLGHAARGFELPFPDAAPGDGNDYAHLATGHLEPGIQIGFCNSTCGGWAPEFVAHDSQIHHVPDAMSDEQAVMVEPAAGGIHAALLTWPAIATVDQPVVAVLGAGTMGLCAVAGLRRYVPGVQIVVGARYPHHRGHARPHRAVAPRNPTRRRIHLRHRDDAGWVAPSYLRPRRRDRAGARLRPTGLGHLPDRRSRRCHRSRRHRGSAWRSEDRLRLPTTAQESESVMPRPGFVLEVDRSTPPILFWRGENFSLEKLPAGRSRVIYPPEPLKPLDDIDGAIRHALLNPHDHDPLPSLLFAGMKLTIAFDDVSLPLPKMRKPDTRQRVMEAVLDMAAEAGVDDVHIIAALGLHRRMHEYELRHALGDRIYDAFHPRGM
ncbi:MAG: putative oxidoreductase, partial [Acidimicrobiaceae bacterium]